jgi:hypothetical protein
MVFRLGILVGSCDRTHAQNAAVDHFEKKIRPVLVSRCYACHSTSPPRRRAGCCSFDARSGEAETRTCDQPGDPGAAFNSRDPPHGQETQDATGRSAFELVAEFEL